MHATLKMLQGLVVGMVFVLVPLTGRPEMYATPQPWIMIAIGVLGTLFQPGYNPFKKPTGSRDHHSTAFVIWTIYLLQLATMLEAAYLRYPESMSWTALTSGMLIVMLAGLVLRSWAVLVLGHCFSMHLKADCDQPVVESGPYRYIRHPSYTGAMMTYMAAPLFFGSWLTAIVAWGTLLAIFLQRIRIEEGMLIQEIGSAYEEYRTRTYKLVPSVY